MTKNVLFAIIYPIDENQKFTINSIEYTLNSKVVANEGVVSDGTNKFSIENSKFKVGEDIYTLVNNRKVEDEVNVEDMMKISTILKSIISYYRFILGKNNRG